VTWQEDRSPAGVTTPPTAASPDAAELAATEQGLAPTSALALEAQARKEAEARWQQVAAAVHTLTLPLPPLSPSAAPFQLLWACHHHHHHRSSALV
jgi:hypothetical protein